MTDDARDAVDEALAAFAAAHRADPSTDPVPFLERVPAAQQELLTELLDAYLAHAPRPDFDRTAFERSWVSEAVERWRVARQPEAEAATGWRVLLPRLRDRAQLTRERLVGELAKALGATGREEKVGDYYHEMEQELLDPAGISDRVFDALGALLGESAETIRAAGRAPGGTASAAGATFARTASPDPRYEYTTDALLVTSSLADEDWDEIDELFRGGSPDRGEARPPQ